MGRLAAARARRRLGGILFPLGTGEPAPIASDVRPTLAGIGPGGSGLDTLNQLAQLIESCRQDYEKARGGNKAAGTRVRKVMQDIKNKAQEIRQEMLGPKGEGSAEG